MNLLKNCKLCSLKSYATEIFDEPEYEMLHEDYLLKLKEILPLRTKVIFVRLSQRARELVAAACRGKPDHDPK